jgi:YVTN family beta-propeller protein
VTIAALAASGLAVVAASAPAGAAFGVSATVAVGGTPDGVAYDSSTNLVYVDDNADAVTEVSGTTVVGTVPIIGQIEGVAVDSSTHIAYAENISTGMLEEISGTSVIHEVAVPQPQGTPAIDPSTHNVYVANVLGNAVTVVNGTSVIGSIAVGSSPGGQLAFDPGTGNLYVANEGSDTVSVIHGTTVTATIPVGHEPDEVAVNPTNHLVYVTNFGADTVSEISGTSVIATVPTGSEPAGVAVDPTTQLAYVTYFGAKKVAEIRGASVVATTPVDRQPSQIAVNPATDLAYVTNQGSNTLSEITLPTPKLPGWGFAMVLGGTVSATHQGNTTGALNTAVHTGPGTYQVTFPNLGQTKFGVGGGTVDVTGLNNGTPGSSSACKVVSWGPSGTSLVVSVACYGPNGKPADAQGFNVVYANVASQGFAPRLTYLWANDPSASSYTPDTVYQFNSAGGTDTITKLGIGEYLVFTPGLDLSNGTVAVTAYGPTNAQCRIDGWGGGEAVILCSHPGGVAVDSQFTMTWVDSASLLGLASHRSAYFWADQPTSTVPYLPSATYSFNSMGGANVVTPLATGQWHISLAGLGQATAGTVIVTAYGSTNAHCAWGGTLVQDGSSEAANVFCFNGANVPVNTYFTFQYVR